MTEMLEPVAPPNKDPVPEDPINKEPLTIRIHLLCDGTKNNRENIAERDKFELGQDSDSYKKFGTGKDNSYDNGRTNIAIMEPHIDDGPDKNDYQMIVKVYVEGQGTTKFIKDDLTGYALGAGLSGVYQRARTGIDEAISKLQDKLFSKKKPERFYIKQVDVDVFGFSRGAATARHAIYAMTTEETMTISSPDGSGVETVVITHPLFQRFRQLGYRETRADQIKIKFAGLYDTVVSVNASQLLPAWMANNTRDQRAVATAEFALHLAAADEHRSDFPLHTIKSAKDAGTGAEYYLPGVHSDVGGSYNQANETLLKDENKNARIREVKAVGDYQDLKTKKAELVTLGYKDSDIELEETDWATTRAGKHPTEGKLYVYRQINGLEYARPTDEIDRVINRGRVSDLKEDMEHLKEDGWYEDGQIIIDVDYIATAARTALTVVAPILLLTDGSPKSGRLISNRLGITTAYSNIPLKLMVEETRKRGILVKEKLDQRANITLATQPELEHLEKDIRKYMCEKGQTGSTPDDWLNIKTAEKIHMNIRRIRNKHMHMSSRFDSPVIDPGFTPRIISNLRKRFYYEG